MTPAGDSVPLLSRRDALLWLAGFVVIAIFLVGTSFTSDDPDSALYANISQRMQSEPMARWMAPEWWGFWPETGMTGYFREHPAGLFWLPAALGRLGIPAQQAAYVVGIAAALGSVVLIGVLVRRLVSPTAGRAVLVLLQLMPVAFIFRIRANHEYPMLFALALVLVGLEGVGRSWKYAPLVAVGLTIGMLVKGVFVAIIFLAAGLWLLINPGVVSRARWRGALAVLAGAAVMVGVALLYDWQYQRVTGETFWRAYWARQLGPLEIATPGSGGAALLHNAGFYASRLLWHPAPWSFALVAAGFALRQRLGEVWRAMPPPTRRGLGFGLAFAILSVGLLAPSSRFAERYVFSATYAIATMGAVIALARWRRLRASFLRFDSTVPALPALVWTGLMLLRLVLGPVLPRF